MLFKMQVVNGRSLCTTSVILYISVRNRHLLEHHLSESLIDMLFYKL